MRVQTMQENSYTKSLIEQEAELARCEMPETVECLGNRTILIRNLGQAKLAFDRSPGPEVCNRQAPLNLSLLLFAQRQIHE